MPAIASCQLLIDPPACGAWNMAVDEVLLNAAVRSGRPTLRFYQWQRPTLSLSYFQKAADRTLHRASADVDLVRRLSGGGAILHDRELTYSLTMPASSRLAGDTRALYDVVHQTIVATLNLCLTTAASPWQAELCQLPAALDAADEPFLCFQRRTAGDVLLGKNKAEPPTRVAKIAGSAQRRRRGAVLQHGSLLLSKSAAAPELDGIADITQLTLQPGQLLESLAERLARDLSLDLEESVLPKELVVEAEQLQHSKYRATSWTGRR